MSHWPLPREKQAVTQDIVSLHFERIDKSVVDVGDAKALVEHDEGLCQRVNNPLRLDVTSAEQAV